MKTILITIAISLLIGGFIGWSLKPDKDCPDVKPDTLIEYRYITKHDTLVIPKFRTVVYNDTISYIDTVFVHTNVNYIAEIDTTYEDSSLTAKVQFISDIPLSKKSYFDLKFNLREKTITNTVTVEKDKSFWDDRFPVILGGGIGYDINKKDMSVNFGIYVGVRIN